VYHTQSHTLDVQGQGQVYDKLYVTDMTLDHLVAANQLEDILKDQVYDILYVTDMTLDHLVAANQLEDILKEQVYDILYVTDMTLDHLVAANQLEEMLKDQVRDVLLQRHRHLNEKHEKKHHDGSSSKIHLPIIRSLADIGRKYSLPKEMHKEGGY